MSKEKVYHSFYIDPSEWIGNFFTVIDLGPIVRDEDDGQDSLGEYTLRYRSESWSS